MSTVFFILPLFSYSIFATEKININTASLTQLDQLEGIGPAYAQRIIDGRPYSSLDDLLRVKGIGSTTLQKIKDQGLACVDCDTTLTTTPTPVAPSPTPAASSSPAPTKNFQYSQNVLINEFLPYPEKDAKEWLELLNNGSVAVDLTGWQIDDDDNSTAPQIIPENTVIKPGELLVVSFNKSTLNNDGDKVRLLWPDDQIIHVISYAKAAQGQSAIKITNGWVWTNQPTPGQANKKSFFAKSNPENTPSAAAEKISPVEESVLIGNEPASQTPTAPKAYSTASNNPEPALNTPKTTPGLNLTASINSATKESSGLKNNLILITVLFLAGLSAIGLVYFRRLRQVDNASPDD